MTAEQASQFIGAAKDDPKLQQKISEAVRSAVVGVGAEAGYNFTAEECSQESLSAFAKAFDDDRRMIPPPMPTYLSLPPYAYLPPPPYITNGKKP